MQTSEIKTLMWGLKDSTPYISVYLHMSVYPIKVKGKNKLKLLKSWYGYHRWYRELKCVITKRQAAQHAKFTADIHGKWKRYKPHRHKILAETSLWG